MLLSYEDFKTSLLKGLQDFYGKDAEIGLEKLQRNNGKTEDGLWIRSNGPEAGDSAVPLFSLQKLYEDYKEKNLCIEDCIKFVYRKEKDTGTAAIVKLADRIREWPFVRDRVYPILLSTKENEKLLEDLISTPLLDLSIAYIIRMGNTKTAFYSVKVSRSLFDQYGVSQEELHRQAIKNLQRDGYRFQDMRTLLADFLPLDHSTASILYELGWNAKDIQEWLGHADYYTTMNIYTHIDQAHRQEQAHSLDGILEKNFSGRGGEYRNNSHCRKLLDF